MLTQVTVLLVLHSLEILLWAKFYLSRNCFPDWETAYYFSLVSYTTLGFGDVVLVALPDSTSVAPENALAAFGTNEQIQGPVHDLALCRPAERDWHSAARLGGAPAVTG